MRESEALIAEAKELLDANEGRMGSLAEAVTISVEAAELALRAMQVHGDIKVVHGLGLAASWDRLEAERIVPELPKVREMLAEMEKTEVVVNHPTSLGPTRSQAHQARTSADLLLNVAALTLSPTNPLASLIKAVRESAPGF